MDKRYKSLGAPPCLAKLDKSEDKERKKKEEERREEERKRRTMERNDSKHTLDFAGGILLRVVIGPQQLNNGPHILVRITPRGK